MSDDTTSRRYDEKEVRLLLQRAAEIQAQVTVPERSTGLSLAELEDIAREAGLSPDALRRAARELEPHSAAGFGSSLAGGPLRLELEDVVLAQPDETVLAEIVALIQRAADIPGQVSRIGPALTWSSQAHNSVRQLQVGLTTSNGETRVWIEERYGALAGLVFGAGLGGFGWGLGGGLGGALGGAFGSVALGVGIPAVVLPATYLGCRVVFRRYVQRRHAVLERLLRDITDRLRA